MNKKPKMEAPIPPKELARIIREVMMSMKNPKRTPEMFDEAAIKLRNELRGTKMNDAKKKIALADAGYRRGRRPSNLTRSELSDLRKYIISQSLDKK
jgi:hypothetical protein